MFFSFDGIDGAGKSTQIQRFVRWLRDQQRPVIACRDPGTTALGEAIRRLLLDDHEHRRDCRAEMFLYMAARAQLVDEVIGPAIDSHRDVVSDRYLLANVVYQGHAGQLDPELIWEIGRTATRGILPELTFVLDLPVEKLAERIQSAGRQADRMEQRGLEYLGRVRDGFLAEARRQPDRIVVIDASQSVEQVERQIRAAAIERFNRAG